MTVLLDQLAVRGIDPVFLWPVGEDWRNRLHELPPAGSIDAVVVNGEGSIHHSHERPRADCLADLSELARDHYGVPSFLVNSTLYKNMKSLYDKVKGFDAVYVRDSGSLKELQRHGLTGHVVPDLTFNLPVKPGDRPRRGVGVIDSVDRGTTGRLRTFARESKADFLPMQTPRSMPPWQNLRRPVGYARKLKTFVRDHIECRTRPADVPGFQTWLQDKSLVVTGRYHALTLCLGTATPFIACESNTPKISWLLHDVFGNDSRMADPAALKTDGFAGFSTLEQQQLDRFVSHATQATRAMFDEIAAMIHSREALRIAQ